MTNYSDEARKSLDEYYNQDKIITANSTLALCPRSFTNISALSPSQNIIDPNNPICDCPYAWECPDSMIVARSLPLACPIH